MAKRSQGRSAPRMARRHRPPLWHLALSGGLVAAAVVLIVYVQWERRPPDPPPPSPAASAFASPAGVPNLAVSLRGQADTALEELGIWPGLIDKSPPAADAETIDTVSVRVPADLPLAVVNLSLTRLVADCGGRVLRASEFERPRRVEIRCGTDTLATTLFVLRHDPRIQRRTGRIAIVLDDFGSMSKHLVGRFCSLPQPLTLAILPNEGDIDEMLALVRRRGHELIVHLPMEPDGYPEKNPGDNAILVDQDGTRIRQLVRAAVRRVPGATGFSNHMGSRATADRRVMEEVLLEVKRQGMFFLDSRTTAASVACDMARAMGIRAARRDVFLDPVDQSATPENQLWELAAVAAEKGQAIGVGHDREETLVALEAILPRLESRGFRFVPLSALAR